MIVASEAAFAISEGKSVVSIGDLQIRTKDNDGKIIYENDPQKHIQHLLYFLSLPVLALHKKQPVLQDFDQHLPGLYSLSALMQLSLR